MFFTTPYFTYYASAHSRENPDVVFLQEVVPDTLTLIEELCPTYQAIPSAHEGSFLQDFASINWAQFSVNSLRFTLLGFAYLLNW